ncbi:MAG: methyltransferase domain-containing protein [Betaproteobacteria bacterium]|nr:methyltransferase domain-containing protein [Betaproteobacteria bacterium]
MARRKELAARFLAGDGIEIGALHEPLATPPAARVRYLDRLSLDKLREHYPELDGQPLVNVDIVDDGETLATIPDGALDFVIANHMLEHCENPLGAIRNHFRAVRKGGVLYYAVPDKRFSFDKDRQPTPIDHFTVDDRPGPSRSRDAHFEEWVRLVLQINDPQAVRDEIERLKGINYSIHFHVWDFDSFMEFVDLVRDCNPQLEFDWTHIELNVGEIVSVFTKR